MCILKVPILPAVSGSICRKVCGLKQGFGLGAHTLQAGTRQAAVCRLFFCYVCVCVGEQEVAGGLLILG